MGLRKGFGRGFHTKNLKRKTHTPMENKGQSGGHEPIPPVGSHITIFQGVNSANSTPRDNFPPGSPKFPRGHDRETTPLPLGALEGASPPSGAPAYPPADRGDTPLMVSRGGFPTEAPQEFLNDPENDSNLPLVPFPRKTLGCDTEFQVLHLECKSMYKSLNVNICWIFAWKVSDAQI